MVFHIDCFTYLNFWYAAWNVLVFWKLNDLHNQWGLHKVTQSHRVVKFIQIMPLIRCWTDHLGTYAIRTRNTTLCTFHLSGLEEFLVLVEDELENLGDESLERQHTIN